jgi:hypothetical protein
MRQDRDELWESWGKKHVRTLFMYRTILKKNLLAISLLYLVCSKV